jgi:transcriptional regulator GlxA family with amidase domain
MLDRHEVKLWTDMRELRTRRLSMTPRHLQRLFMATFDRSPKRVLRLIRVRHARWLLENSTVTLTQIALECGFAGASNFSRAFVQETRCSPGQFRQQGARRSPGP